MKKDREDSLRSRWRATPWPTDHEAKPVGRARIPKLEIAVMLWGTMLLWQRNGDGIEQCPVSAAAAASSLDVIVRRFFDNSPGPAQLQVSTPPFFFCSFLFSALRDKRRSERDTMVGLVDRVVRRKAL